MMDGYLMKKRMMKTMSDLIDRQAVIDIVYRQRFGLQKLSFDIIMEKLSELPSAEPERKTGKWIIYDIALFDGGVDVKCSECGQCGCAPYWDFCPNCGAKMEEDDE